MEERAATPQSQRTFKTFEDVLQGLRELIAHGWEARVDPRLELVELKEAHEDWVVGVDPMLALARHFTGDWERALDAAGEYQDLLGTPQDISRRICFLSMFDDDVASGLLNDEDSITGPTLAKLFFDDTSTEEEGWLFPKQRAQLLEACGIKTNES